MTRPGNKRPSIAAKAIFVLIVGLVAAVVWLGIKGAQKEPAPPAPGSQSLPKTAADAQILPTKTD